MWASLRNKELYLLVLGVSLLIGVMAFGGGLFGQAGPWFSQWQHKSFAGLCHQDPLRSFRVNGVPMAVCARCLGIYTSFAVFWTLFPLRSEWMSTVRCYGKMLLVGIVLLNVGDVAGNILGLWENTLYSRYMMGTTIGIAAAAVLGCGFIGKRQPKGKYHGTIRIYKQHQP